jgi:Ser/Thr protein kinase RdoA (MazF antagonist)
MNGDAAIREIAGRFALDGELEHLTPHGGGHINDSFQLSLRLPEGSARFLLQRLNGRVFPDPPLVMENIRRVTAHLARSLEAEEAADAGRRVLSLVQARDGTPFVRDRQGDSWRLYPFIEGTRTILSVTLPAEAEAGGRAFGGFQRRLADLPGPRLGETIAGFHDTSRRFADLERAVEADVCGRAGETRAEIDYAMGQRAAAPVLLEALRTGRLPERVVHNDAKISNVLLDRWSAAGICVVDLDTVMPGTALFDFGDMVRTMTSYAAEDEADPGRAGVDLELFESLAGGYLSEMGPLLTPEEQALLVTSGRLITLEIGVRFLSDYLSGDTYFRTDCPEQNLRRCRAQLAHHRSLVSAAPELERIIRRV